MLLRREVYARVGGMDTSYWMYSEETDWCYRIQQSGYKLFYLPDVAIIHIGGASTRQRKPEMMAQLTKSKVLFFAKNYGAARARQLQTLLWIVYGARELAGRAFMLLPRFRDRGWREVQVARLIRAACAQAVRG